MNKKFPSKPLYVLLVALWGYSTISLGIFFLTPLFASGLEGNLTTDNRIALLSMSPLIILLFLVLAQYTRYTWNFPRVMLMLYAVIISALTVLGTLINYQSGVSVSSSADSFIGSLLYVPILYLFILVGKDIVA